MDPGTIKSLIDAMAASDLAEMEFSEDGWALRLVRHAGSPGGEASPPPRAAARSAVPAVPARPAGPTSRDLAAPLFGLVYLSPSPGAPPFVTPGQVVEAGTTVCVIEAMKVFQEIRSGRAGTIEAILVGSGDEVEAGQVLARFA